MATMSVISALLVLGVLNAVLALHLQHAGGLASEKRVRINPRFVIGFTALQASSGVESSEASPTTNDGKKDEEKMASMLKMIVEAVDEGRKKT